MKKIITGITGLSIIIIIHECGHLFFARLFGVATPIFSIGFGPQLIGIPTGKTVFQLALIPLGGYVEIDPDSLAIQPYLVKMIIMFGGIIFNFILAYIIIYVLKHKKNIAQT